ncbi:MAG: phtD [Hyphomicrobiales bacterium]|jgi:4,5-dihydroxyphthalate decarboxylase|nr:phtD [Hyphomicrobiales bacterium]
MVMKLHTALQTLGHTQALKDGTIKPQTFEFEFEEVPQIIQAFRRMVRGLEFDISEMAITTYLCAKANGKKFTAIPVFPFRAFHHGAIVTNTRLGITDPKQLEGKKVGVNRGYTVTAGVWARSILQHDYGVDLSKVTWVLSGDEHVAEYKAPANVVPIEAGKKIEDMLLSGELAAASGIVMDHPDIKPLIPNPAQVGFEALRARGHYPINHTLVVKDELLEAHPGLAKDIFETFSKAKKAYVERLRAGVAEPTKNDQTVLKIMEITGKDPMPFGVEPNRAMIEAINQFATEQQIIPRPFKMDEIWAKGTLDLVG